jgi:hypothetical protein
MGQKSIRSVSASASTAPGTAAGMPTVPNMASLLHEDLKIREYLREEPQAGCCLQDRDRASAQEVPRDDPLGSSGCSSSARRARTSRSCAASCLEMTDSEVHLNIVEVRKPEIDANLVAQSIAQQLERRIAFRRAMKRAVQSAMRLGAEGIRSTAAAVSAARKSPVPNGTAKAGCRCTRCAPTSITAPPKRRPPTASAASRSGSSRARSSSTIRWRRSAARRQEGGGPRPAVAGAREND